MKIDRIKVSELPPVEDINNIDVLGVNRQTNSSGKMNIGQFMAAKQDKLIAGNGIDIKDNVVSVKDTGWVDIIPIDPRITWEDDSEPIRYRRIGDVIYFKCEVGVFLNKGSGGNEYSLIGIGDLGISHEEAFHSSIILLDGNVSLTYNYAEAYVFRYYDGPYVETDMYHAPSIILG